MEVTLPAANRFLQVRFALNDYTYPEKNSYAVLLEGFDDDWVSIGNNSEVRYNNLPSGSYTLRVRGFGPSGIPSENTLAMRIHVKQFFHKSTAFYLLLTTFAVLLGMLWIWRLRREKSRLEEEVQKRTREIIEDKKTIEAQTIALQELDRMKSRFFANISHELRTPLTLILGPMKRLLQYDDLDMPTVRQHLSMIVKNGDLLHRQIEELLELSRLDAGKITLRKKRVDLLKLLENTLSRFHTHATQKGILLRLDWRVGALPTVWLDDARLDKIIGNLLSNALKFTQAGQVDLVVSRSTTATSLPDLIDIAFTITDTGKGIPSEDLPFIFDRYFQTQSGRPTAEGTGIGLAIAKELTEAMGGEIAVSSEVGKGSTFTVVMPVEKAEQEGLTTAEVTSEVTAIPALVWATPTASAAPDDTTEDATILLAEDNLDLQAYLWQILRPRYKVVCVNNGLQAWEYLQRIDRPAKLLVLSDIMMPEMDGLTLVSKVKADNELRKIPFILLTAKVGNENRISALRMGIDDYLTKPFEEEELLARIRNLFNNLNLRIAAHQEETLEDTVAYDTPVAKSEWLEQLETLSLDLLSHPQMSMDYLAEKMGISRSSLHRRIKSETGLSANLYLREIRLQEARRLLENQLSGQCSRGWATGGFPKSEPIFSTLFQERFGCLPSSVNE
ncbi:MAG: ATP-binding protein [Saprospiraceae bacterium]